MKLSSAGDPGDRFSEESRAKVAGVRAYTSEVDRAGIAIANTKNISVES